MHREAPTLFSAPFFKKYGIKPYQIDAKTMDLEGEFIQELMDSVKAGYDMTKPILIAKCEGDDRIDGYPIDGRHRLYALAKLQERKVALPSPFPLSFIDVKDANHLRALIAQYEERNRAKGGKFSKAWINENLGAIVEDNIETHKGDIVEYIQSLGFTNTTLISKVVDDYNGGPKKKVKKDKKVRNVKGLPESLWTEKTESVYATNDENFDLKITYKECPDCKNLLKITSDLQGRILKLEKAPKLQN